MNYPITFSDLLHLPLLADQPGTRALFERLTFDRLMSYSDPKRITRASTVRVPPLKFDTYKDQEAYYFNAKSSPSTTGLRHKGYVKIFKPKNPNTPLEKCDCETDCQCPDFKFRWAWANKQRGSSHVGPNSLNQAWNKAPRITNPTGRPGLCVASGERISTLRGLIPIEEVVVGDSVWTLSGWKPVTASACTGTKSIVEVLLRSGRKLRLTPEHQVYAFYDSTGFAWMPAGQVTSEASLCISLPADTTHIKSSFNVQEYTGKSSGIIHYPARDISLDETMAELIGYMVAEGSEGSFAGQNPHLCNDFAEKWRLVFGPQSVTVGPNGCTIGRNGTRILKQMGFLFGSYNKIVPEWIMRGNRSIVLAFIRGAYAGDGNFRIRHSTYGSVSEKLARSLQLLLNFVCVNTSLNCYPSGVNKSLTWVLRTSSAEETDKLFQLLQPIRGYSSTPITGKCGHYQYVTKNAKNLFENVIRSTFPICKDNTVVPVNEVGRYVPGCGKVSADTVALNLLSNGHLQKMRLRRGGKESNVATLAALFEATKDYRASSITRSIRLPRTTGWGIHKQELKPSLEKLKTIAPEAYEELRTLCRDDVILDEVVAVIPGDVVNVYDLTVESANHFTVNGVVVHNCKHIIATRDFIYGQFRSFASEQEKDATTVDKLDRLISQSTKRWSDFPGEVAKARERDQKIQQSIERAAYLRANPSAIPPINPSATDQASPLAKTVGAKAAGINPIATGSAKAGEEAEKAGADSVAAWRARKSEESLVVNRMANLLERDLDILIEDQTEIEKKVVVGKPGPSPDEESEVLKNLREIRDIVRHLAGDDLPADLARSEEPPVEPGIPVDAAKVRDQN